MDTLSNMVDRTGWPAGEWDNEPDRATWIHDETGARCTLRRGPLGSWCGYVGLRPNHPAAGRDYNDLDVSVHGGLTFGSYCRPMGEDEWIRYRLIREHWMIDSLIHPEGDAARHLREDRMGDTSTFDGYRKWMTHWVLCHEDCPHGLWWVGFDTAHSWDVIPGMLAHYQRHGIDPLFPGGSYKTIDWMVEEVNKLAAELFTEKFIASMEGKHEG